jgi:hypothetical protein
MNHRQKIKRRLKALPRSLSATDAPRPRQNATYFEDWCCRDCFFWWGRGAAKHKHGFAQSNFDGALRPFWKKAEPEMDADLLPTEALP